MFYQNFDKPQLVIFYISLVLIGAANFAQFDFLITEYWSATERLSKGPIIWAVSLIVIHLDLSKGEFKKTTTNIDLLFMFAMVLILSFGLLLDPLIAPTLLLIGVWHLVSGTANTSRLLIVWLFLFFSLPFFSQLLDLFVVEHLRSLVIIVTESLFGIAGIPILVQAFYIAIPEGMFYVAEDCAGVRFMSIHLLLAFVYSIMSRFSFYQFLLALLVAIVMAMLTNWIRIIVIVLIAHYFGINHDLVQNHGNSGWFIYATLLVPYFYLMLKIDSHKTSDITINRTNIMQVLPFPACLLLLLPLTIVFWHQWLR